MIASTNIVITTTVVLIAAILTIYLTVLRKSGWIGGNTHYRCPNPQCEKIFDKPVKVKDYSNKKLVRIACPDCGFDLGSDKDEKLLKQIEIEKNTKMIRDSLPAETTIEKPEIATIDNSNEPTAIKSEAPTPTIQAPSIINSSQEVNFSDTEISSKSKENRITPKKNEKAVTKRKKNVKQEKPDGCNNNFGYLASLSKVTATPDECYSCNKLLDCRKQTAN